MKKYVLLAVTALVGLAAVSCKEKEIEPEDALSIAGTTITVGKEAAAPAVTFTANKAWKAESDSQWITPDQTSGEPGNITLNIAVAENDTWAERSGKVTVSVGTVKTVFTIVQGTESILESSLTFSISPESQDIQVPVKTNLDYTVTPLADWITVVSTKAAPKEGTITVHVSANTELVSRTGSFSISAPGYSQTYTIVQTASWVPAESASAIYIGNSQSIYNTETYMINLHQQYVVKLASSDGDQVTLVLNKKGEEQDGVFQFYPIDKIPQGSFGVDATATKEDNTFSIQSSTGAEKYYTGIVSNGRDVTVYDGEIVVEEADGVYTVTSVLVDSFGAEHRYSYIGPIAISTEFCGGQATVNWKNTYDTHFTTQANGWYLEFYLPRKNPADENEVAYASFTFFSAPGDVNLEELPAGTYTYAVVEDADLKYANGKKLANPGVLTLVSVSLYNEAGGIKYTEVSTEGTAMTMTKNDDGTTNIKYSATVKPYYYDESWNLVYEDAIPVSIDINVPVGKATDEQNHPYDDKDDVFNGLEGPAGNVYVGYWYSKYIGVEEDGATPKPAIPDTDCNIFSFGSNSKFNDTWTAMFAVIAPADWEFVGNYPENSPRPNYCSTPVPDGTYTFGTEAKIGALIPLRNNTASRCYITNNYTGTTYYPVSGSITLFNGQIAVDLVCKATATALEGRPNSAASVHFTGGGSFVCSYLTDYSAVNRVKPLSINSPVPID